MNKRLISLLLVIVMICTLLPMAVLADPVSEPDTSEETKTILDAQDSTEMMSIFLDALKDLIFEDQETKATVDTDFSKYGMVAVPVFGKQLTEIIEEQTLFDSLEEAVQVRLTGKTIIPEMKITITGTDENTESIQNQRLERVDYSVFNGVTSHVEVNFQGKKTFAQIMKKFASAIGPIDTLGIITGIFNSFGIPMDDEAIDAMMENPSDKMTKVLGIIGSGKYEDEDGELQQIYLDPLHLKEFNGLGLNYEDCKDIDVFANALYKKYGEKLADDTFTNLIQNAASNVLAQYSGYAYHTYVAQNLPEGNYEIYVEEIVDRQGYVVVPERTYQVTVEKGETTFAGEPKEIGTNTFDLKELLSTNSSDNDTEQPDIPDAGDNSILAAITKLFEAKDKIGEIYNNIVDSLPQKDKIKLPVVGEIDLPLTIDFIMTFTGLWLDRIDPSIGFSNQDLGGNPITAQKTENQQGTFVMVDRDQLILVMEAMLDAGKDTFENAVNGLKDVFTDDENAVVSRDEFVQMHKELVAMKESEDGTQQISFEAAKLLPILRVYVKMLDIPSVWKDFMAKDVRFPAILETTADADGVVRFTEDSNVTLTWMLDVIVKLADFSNEQIQELSALFLEDDAKLTRDLVAEICAATDLSENLQNLLVEVLIKLMEMGEDGGEAAVALLKLSAPTIKSVLNKWIYPILQNDAFFRTMFFAVGVEHGILTEKMPDSYYLMLQKKAPEGYIINPMVYTVKLDWDENDWVYAKVVNLGIVLPYFAEDYYTFLRNNSIAKTSDAILNRISNGKYETLIQDIISGKVNATEQVVTASATGIAFQSWIMYNFMGGRLVYKGEDGQTALQNDLVKWLKAKGNTAQNLLGFGDEIYQRSKAVVTADLTLTENEEPEDMWAFYNASKSIKENIVAQATAIMKGISGSIVTDGSKVNGAVKDAIDKVIEGAAKIDTTSKLAAAVDQAKQKITETVTKVATSLITTAIKKTASLFSSLFKSLRS